MIKLSSERKSRYIISKMLSFATSFTDRLSFTIKGFYPSTGLKPAVAPEVRGEVVGSAFSPVGQPGPPVDRRTTRSSAWVAPGGGGPPSRRSAPPPWGKKLQFVWGEKYI